MKILNVHHENLDLVSWKSRPFIMKILTVYHENLDVSHKNLTVRKIILTCHHENKSQLLAEMAFHILQFQLVVMLAK